MGTRRSRAVRALVAGAVTAGMVITATGGPASAGEPGADPAGGAGPAWRVVPTPLLRSHATLTGVTASGPSDAWAVGSLFEGGTVRALAMHWDGREWSRVVMPHSGERTYLTSVSGTSATDVWAVGYDVVGATERHTVVMHYDGTSWSIVPSPNVAGHENVLWSVAAVSRDEVWAVGSSVSPEFSGRTLVLRWDGSSWSVVPSPNPSEAGNGSNLLAVAAGAPSEMWAVGNYDEGDSVMRTLAQQWDGSTWQTVPSPTRPEGALLSSVAAYGGQVWAVGWRLGLTDLQEPRYQPYALRWDGAAWQETETPSDLSADISFADVAITESGTVWAVGERWPDTLAARWTGSEWQVVGSASPGTLSNQLLSVTAIPGTTCLWAVGQYSRKTQVEALVERHCG